MTGSGSHRIAWMCACLAFGPVYLLAATLASVVEIIPNPILISWQEAIQLPLLFIPALLFGFFAAAIPFAFLILILSAFARSWRPLRAPFAWTVVGGAAPALLLFLAGVQDFSSRAALVVAGMVSLRFARSYLAWPDDDDAFAVLGSQARTL
ncbi:MAG TPA: hypothetical protein VF655_13480 [Allosphingosinicella sp.]|jgi:hypothetical protein